MYQIALSQVKITVDPMNDNFGHIDTTDIQDFGDRLIVKIELDFNNDGITDLVISNTEAWGNAGGDWSVYLGRKDGNYDDIGYIFFHPLAFRIMPQTDGYSNLVIYHRMGGGEGDLIEYSISKNGIKELSSRIMRPDTEGESDNVEYMKLFGDLYNNPKSICCRLTEYIKNKNCKWYPGYYIQDK